MTNSGLAALFWLSGLLLAYIYVGYPALCRLRARFRPKPWKHDPEFRPFVSVLVAAYNEQWEIGRRIRNIAEQETGFRFEVLVGSDGSNDATFPVASQAAAEAMGRGTPVRVFQFARRGKMATLASLLHEARGEVVVFTDANSRFAPGALRAVVAPLADASVGCAGGMKRIDSGHDHTAAGEQSYWGFENRLKSWESAAGSCAGVDGALYAVRRADVPPLITNRLLADDFYISLAACSGGRRCVVVPDAVVLEASDTTSANELRRKARILAGALTALALQRKLLRPGSGLSLTLWSHKVLRWFAFVPIAAMMVGAMGLPLPEARIFYFLAGIASAAVAVGALFPASVQAAPIKVPYYFALMNFGQVLGMVEWIRNRDQPAWQNVRVMPIAVERKDAA